MRRADKYLLIERETLLRDPLNSVEMRADFEDGGVPVTRKRCVSTPILPKHKPAGRDRRLVSAWLGQRRDDVGYLSSHHELTDSTGNWFNPWGGQRHNGRGGANSSPRKRSTCFKLAPRLNEPANLAIYRLGDGLSKTAGY